MTLTKTGIEPDCNTARATARTIDIVCGAVREILTLEEPKSFTDIYHALRTEGIRPIRMDYNKGTLVIVIGESYED